MECAWDFMDGKMVILEKIQFIKLETELLELKRHTTLAAMVAFQQYLKLNLPRS